MAKKIVVFTNGCYDLFHPGHLHILKEAKKLGDILIVGVCSDKSRMEYCGKPPIHNCKFRKELIESLRFVDSVIVHDEPTVKELVKLIKPDIIVKGGEYKKEEVVGWQYAKEVKLIPMLKDYSTTKIKEKIGAKQ